MLINCPRCKGQKKISQLGFMQTQCDVCKGAGYLKEKEMEVGEVVEPITKKRVRPAKGIEA